VKSMFPTVVRESIVTTLALAITTALAELGSCDDKKVVRDYLMSNKRYTSSASQC